MRYFKLAIISMLLLAFTVGCSTSHSVQTASTKALTTALNDELTSIEHISYSFTRPDLTIHVRLNEALNLYNEEVILYHVKQFASVENLNEIAKSVKWGLEISEIHLNIYEPSIKKPVSQYYTKYFNTYDASNYSIENIDGYNTWFKLSLN